jgi:NAD(P)-dependent dehydrogenase (short-subunit alcohol dehydrogenase family)
MSRKVFISGGTGSVGRALVNLFTRAGHQVVFQYHLNEAEARALASDTGAQCIPIDFSKDACPRLNDIEVLINNAAINASRALAADVRIDDWDEHLRINLTWPFLFVKECIPYMKEKGWGRIINISSIYGLRACEGNLPYNVSKHGLSALTKTVAKEYGEYGISSNEICPGPIQSKLLTKIAQYHAKEDGISVADYFSALEEDIPSGRLAAPEDIAEAAGFLASESSGYINGVSLPVDGGLIA